jgi:hypothetical protein
MVLRIVGGGVTYVFVQHLFKKSIKLAGKELIEGQRVVAGATDHARNARPGQERLSARRLAESRRVRPDLRRISKSAVTCRSDL